MKCLASSTIINCSKTPTFAAYFTTATLAFVKESALKLSAADMVAASAVLSKDTLTCSLEILGIETLTLGFVENFSTH